LAQFGLRPLAIDGPNAVYISCTTVPLWGRLGGRMSERTMRRTRVVSVIAATVIALACGTNVGHA